MKVMILKEDDVFYGHIFEGCYHGAYSVYFDKGSYSVETPNGSIGYAEADIQRFWEHTYERI